MELLINSYICGVLIISIEKILLHIIPIPLFYHSSKGCFLTRKQGRFMRRILWRYSLHGKQFH